MLLVYHFPFSQAAPPVSLPPSVGCDVENRLRHATQRIRVSEFFKDYDPLRTGFITSEPFVIIYCSYLRHRSVPPLSLISTDSNGLQGEVIPRGGWKLGHVV